MSYKLLSITMYDDIPSEIQEEILKRLPVKTLIQFRSVSKAWKALIDSSSFITDYSGQAHLLVVNYEGVCQEFITVLDDDTFPQQRTSFGLVKNYYKIGCSHGLLCLYSDGVAVLWNLSIRKKVFVIVPNAKEDRMYSIVLGFGVCRETTDPKIVKITYIRDMGSKNYVPLQVEVFTLSTGAWRRPCCNLPRTSMDFRCYPRSVTVDGVIYWLMNVNVIISFDFTTEEFGEVKLADSLAFESFDNLSVHNVRESLVVLEHVGCSYNFIQMMESGVFTKLFTINVNINYAPVRGFRKNGAPIVEIFEDPRFQLVVYEPNSKLVEKFWIEIKGDDISFQVYPYMETLLLLDQPDLFVYDVEADIK